MCRSSMFAQCVIHVVTFLHESDVLLVLVQSVNHVEPQCCGDLSWLGDCSNNNNNNNNQNAFQLMMS